MPNMDGTGPIGNGPATGRGFGRCEGAAGIGFGRCFGRRRARRAAGMNLTLTKENQKKILEAELKEIEAEKQGIAAKLKDLEG